MEKLLLRDNFEKELEKGNEEIIHKIMILEVTFRQGGMDEFEKTGISQSICFSTCPAQGKAGE